MSDVIYKEFGEGASKLILTLSPFTLNESQRRFAALREKEESGWYAGSISAVSHNLCTFSAPSRWTALVEACHKLHDYGVIVDPRELGE